MCANSHGCTILRLESDAGTWRHGCCDDGSSLVFGWCKSHPRCHTRIQPDVRHVCAADTNRQFADVWNLVGLGDQCKIQVVPGHDRALGLRVRVTVYETGSPCMPCYIIEIQFTCIKRSGPLSPCRVIDELVWVKTTKYRRLAKSHGYYLQHAKEVCIVARKGRQSSLHSAFCQDLLLSSRRGQSQKPEEIYTVAESCHCTGRYLEVFGRRNNLRTFWITIGNEVVGTCASVKQPAAMTD
mmetsp:Transcript_9338/g.28083  ORF Transcript_9338/g.28083 Transcript_9338/m.28083 type:complete len:240 (-) Transcript_9338:386-1105(-)